VLVVENVHAYYGRIAALQGISLEVHPGEIVGVIGPNGAGKTTLLSAIVGLVACAAGSIAFEGRSILRERPDRIVRRGISLVPEGRRIFARLTVAENLRVGATIRRDRDAVEADVERLLELFPGLRGYLDSPAGKLSGGEQQQLAIARALLARPKLLLLDEPSLGLAPLLIDRVFDSLEELRADGVTILLVEQNAARTIEIADRTYVLRAGRTEFAGSSSEVLRHERFEAAYLGSPDDPGGEV
jgi:branched-chain amino acid transport system ATP-binding protein